ncbi:MAG: hypothetical protein CVV17_09600, partial [Gammaproteobacteria bacterium HGW-Gammaproteobacteria-7]
MQPSTQASNAWRVLFLLFLANLFNFFDRTIPAIIAEPIRLEWSLNDFQLGLPLGLLLAFFTIGSMVEAFGSWRAPFFIAAVPGLVLALFIF